MTSIVTFRRRALTPNQPPPSCWPARSRMARENFICSYGTPMVSIRPWVKPPGCARRTANLPSHPAGHPWLQLTSFCNTLAQWLLFNLSEYYVPSYGYVAERAALDMTLRIRLAWPSRDGSWLLGCQSISSCWLGWVCAASNPWGRSHAVLLLPVGAGGSLGGRVRQRRVFRNRRRVTKRG
jgi:hypothetical protein